MSIENVTKKRRQQNVTVKKNFLMSDDVDACDWHSQLYSGIRDHAKGKCPQRNFCAEISRGY